MLYSRIFMGPVLEEDIGPASTEDDDTVKSRGIHWSASHQSETIESATQYGAPYAVRGMDQAYCNSLRPESR